MSCKLGCTRCYKCYKVQSLVFVELKKIVFFFCIKHLPWQILSLILCFNVLKRVFVRLNIQLSFAIGGGFAVGIAWLVMPSWGWRAYLAICNLPSLIFLILCQVYLLLTTFSVVFIFLNFVLLNFSQTVWWIQTKHLTIQPRIVVQIIYGTGRVQITN